MAEKEGRGKQQSTDTRQVSGTPIGNTKSTSVWLEGNDLRAGKKGK